MTDNDPPRPSSAERVAVLEQRNLALEGQNAVLQAKLDEAVARITQLQRSGDSAQARAIEMMAAVGQTTPVPPDPHQSAQPKKSLTQRAREAVGL